MALKRILHIDDDAVIQDLTRTVFERAKIFEFKTCGSAKEAFSKLPDFKPDLILMDFNMPDMNGPQTLQRLRDNADNTPVIFMTGLEDDIDLSEYDVIGVIRKPFKPRELAETIQSIWDDRFGQAA